MALSLSIEAPLSFPFFASLPSSSLKPIKTLTLQCLRPTSLPLEPILGFSHLSPITINRSIHRRSGFRSSLSAHESAPPSGDQKDENASTREGHNEYPTDVKTQIRVYREALSTGDEKAASEVEAIICSVEKEKDKLDMKVLSLSTQITSGKEKCIRLQADFDNFRTRYEKDRLSSQSSAQRQVIESLLSMVDSFERLRRQIKPETEKEKKIDTSYQGIYRQFVEVLRSLGVSAIAAVGKPFDPLMHEAISREESQEFKEGIVIQELSRGFLYGDDVLRPAKVKVSSGIGHKKAPFATKQSSSEQPATASEQ